MWFGILLMHLAASSLKPLFTACNEREYSVIQAGMLMFRLVEPL